jgi:hypothetical protein
MLWIIIALLLVLWGVGLGLHIAGALIHLLLLIAFVVLVVQLLTGRKAP